MNVRILHCSNSVTNYYLCLHEKVAGFNNRGPKTGDLIYLVVKIGKKSLCGARFVLDEPTDTKPWENPEIYVNALTIKDIEYCNPFEISLLSAAGGKYWAMKYVQGAKPFNDEYAISLIDQEFSRNKSDKMFIFDQPSPPETPDEDKTTIEDEDELNQLAREIPDVKVNIMGTFQTVQFSNETDKIKGLETLVNENFYSLFPQFPEAKTLLISENRLFKTKGFKVDGNNVQGIRTIPDGILIEFNKRINDPFRINLIEYECFGERKQKEIDKSSYLNSMVIPQLMRFASSFSIITDEQTRVKTINSWVDKIIEYINQYESQSSKFIGWIKEINPQIKERAIEREIEKLLIDAFKSNLRVLLVIDELSAEQKSTIKNVVSSFKLSSGEANVQFAGYVVRLVQKINMLNNEAEFALTIQ